MKHLETSLKLLSGVFISSEIDDSFDADAYTVVSADAKGKKGSQQQSHNLGLACLRGRKLLSIAHFGLLLVREYEGFVS